MYSAEHLIDCFILLIFLQNEKITKLKINYNPFAKGFRENGKSNVKRKQVSERSDSPCSKKSATPSPPPHPEVKNDVEHQGRKSTLPVHRYSYYPPYPIYNHQWWAGPIPFYYQYPYGSFFDYDLHTQQKVGKPKKITDFSINAIMRN